MERDQKENILFADRKLYVPAFFFPRREKNITPCPPPDGIAKGKS